MILQTLHTACMGVPAPKGQSGSGVEFDLFAKGASITRRIEISIDVLGFELRIETRTPALRTIHKTESAQVVNTSADREIHNGQVRY